MDQLLLPLVTRPRYTFENLVTHEGNREAVATIRSVYGVSGRAYPWLWLHGASGTGKTHLLHAAAALIERQSAPGTATFLSFDVAGRTVETGTGECGSMLPADLPDTGVALVVDNLHRASEEDGARLFSLANQLTRSGLPLLVASAIGPDRLFNDAPHLRSRLLSGLVFRLEPPDDAVRVVILDKMARDRQVRVSPDVCRYLVTRKARNVKELGKLLDIIDSTSLRLKRRITLTLVRELERAQAI
jgi:DnaA family protein